MATRTITGLTTIFTPPADCRTHWTYEDVYYNSVSNGLLIQNALGEHLDSTCFPKSFTGAGRAPSAQIYSPGACPSGYATPGAFTNDGTTTGICCQSGYKYYTLYSSVNHFASTSELYQGCISTFVGVTTVVARANNTDLSTQAVTGPLTMWGQPIYVEYNQNDLSYYATTTSSSSSLSSSQTSSGTSSTTSVTSSPTPSTSPSSGLSTGAKAGIGIGAAAGILLILGLIAFFIMRHRKNRLRSKADSMEPYSQKPHMAHASPQQWERAELEPNQVYRGEMDGGKSPYHDSRGTRPLTELE